LDNPKFLNTPYKIKSMKKFNYFLLTAITLFLSTTQLKAFTTSSNFNNTIQKIENLPPAFVDITQSFKSSVSKNFEINELQVSATNSSESITDKLTFLYSICVALVLFNLVAQVKIIYQMVHLFFQFQKKDEFAAFTF